MSERTAAPAATARVVVPPCPTPDVSIVIVTYGTDEVVLDALDAVVRHTTHRYEVIVVDNPAPGHSTRDLLRSTTSGVIVASPDENLGFGGGCDAGVELARGELVCFLNPDVIVTEGWLEPLVVALDDPVVAVAAPPLIDPDGTLQEAGQAVLADGFTMAIGGPELFTGDTTQLFDRDVDYASAACWLVRRREHLERGGFDRRFHPAYFEDADYGLRVERAGQVTRLVASRPVVHVRGGGGAGRSYELSSRALTTFRSVHAEELAQRPTRPTDTAAALALRDRRCARRVLHVSRTHEDEGVVQSFQVALHAARQAPRDRVTFVTAHPEVLTAEELDAARRAGLEVVAVDDDDRPASAESATSVDAVVEARADWATEVVHAPTARRRPSPALIASVTSIVVAGIVARWIVLRSSAGRLNADEAYTGVQSFEILGGQFPVVLGGTAYTAVFESYLYAPYAATFGAGILSLKLIATGFWAIASLVIAAIARDVAVGLNGPHRHRAADRAAVLAGGFAWVAPGALLTLSTNAYESYASGMAVTATAFWLARRLTDHHDPSWKIPFALGVASGLGFWMHPMFLSTLVPMLLVVVVRHRTNLTVWVRVAVGGVLGCGPLLLWNAVNAWPSLTSPTDVPGTYGDRFTTFLRDLVPRAFGLRDGGLDWMLGPVVGGALYVVLIAVVLAGVIVAVRADRRPSRFLLPAVLVAVFPIMALFPPLVFAADGRYGIISFPFIVVALAVAITRAASWAASRQSTTEPGASRTTSTTTVTAAVFALAALVWVAGYLGPQLGVLLDETDGDPNADIVEVADRITTAGLEHVNGSYWRVLPVEFVSNDTITGAVLAPLPVRFPERQRTAEGADPQLVAFVFQPDDEDPERLPLPVDAYDRSVIGDTVLYLPRP